MHTCGCCSCLSENTPLLNSAEFCQRRASRKCPGKISIRRCFLHILFDTDWPLRVYGWSIHGPIYTEIRVSLVVLPYSPVLFRYFLLRSNLPVSAGCGTGEKAGLFYTTYM